MTKKSKNIAKRISKSQITGKISSNPTADRLYREYVGKKRRLTSMRQQYPPSEYPFGHPIREEITNLAADVSDFENALEHYGRRFFQLSDQQLQTALHTNFAADVAQYRDTGIGQAILGGLFV